MRATGIGSENNSRPRPDDSRCPLLLIGVPIVGGRPFNGLCSDWDVRTIDFERCSVIEHGDPCVVASGEDPSGDRIVGQLQSRRWRGEGSRSLDDPVFGGLKVTRPAGISVAITSVRSVASTSATPVLLGCCAVSAELEVSSVVGLKPSVVADPLHAAVVVMAATRTSWSVRRVERE